MRLEHDIVITDEDAGVPYESPNILVGKRDGIPLPIMSLERLIAISDHLKSLQLNFEELTGIIQGQTVKEHNLGTLGVSADELTSVYLFQFALQANDLTNREKLNLGRYFD